MVGYGVPRPVRISAISNDQLDLEVWPRIQSRHDAARQIARLETDI